MNKRWLIRGALFSFTIGTLGLIILTMILLRLIQAPSSYAQSEEILKAETMLPLAAVEDGQLQLFGFEEEPQLIADLPLLPIGQYTWSPDGNYLLYHTISDEGVRSLMLVDTLGSETVEIATGLNTFLPPTFSIDGTRILYAIAPNPEEAQSIGAPITAEIYGYIIGSNENSMLIGTVEIGTCGGGGPLPYDALYWAEAGAGGNHPIFVETPFGLLYSSTCNGLGLMLFATESNETITLNETIIRPTVSADRSQVLGINVDDNTLILLDIASGLSNTIALETDSDQIIWGSADTDVFYYTTRTTLDETVTYDAEQQQAILNATGIEVAEVVLSSVSLHRFNLETEDDEILYTSDAYAIGRLTVLPDNRIVMFSEVPSLVSWFDAILASEANAETPSIETTLKLLSLTSGDVRHLATGLQYALLNDDAYVRMFGVQPQITVQPITVTTNTQVNVTGSNFPGNVRVLVYLGSNDTDLDDVVYAAGFTDVEGNITLSFNMPRVRASGAAFAEGRIALRAATSDDQFWASTTLTYSNAASVQPTTRPSNLPTAVVPANISISPTSGTVGTQINVNGRNFPANTRVNIHLGPANTGASRIVYASAFSDNNGNVSLTFNMPGVYQDGTPIRESSIIILAATEDFRSTAALAFSYTPISQPVALPSISVSPTSGTAATKVTVNGYNYPINTSVNILVGLSANELRGVYRTVSTDSKGNFSTVFNMPERWPDGKLIQKGLLTIVAASNPAGTSMAATFAYTPPTVPSVPTATPTTGITPVVPTDAPTEIPIEPTDVPIEPTDIPVEPTDIPVEPSETPTEITVVNPSISVTPNLVNAGETFSVAGQDFTPESVIVITFTQSSVSILPDLTLTISSSGSFNEPISLPTEIEAGDYTVTVTVDDGTTLVKIITVTTTE